MAGCASPQLYPMYLISVVSLLELEKLLPHQDLLRAGKLVEYTPAHAGHVLFVSHQWLGFSEPDPHGTKLRALQQLLRRMLEHGFRQNIQAHWSSQMNGFHPVLTAAELKAALPHALVWMDCARHPRGRTAGPARPCSADVDSPEPPRDAVAWQICRCRRTSTAARASARTA